jgi:pre-rRNA-processing protein TSR3
MQKYPVTIILRHRRENLKKCSLRGLESLPFFSFFTYPKDHLPEESGYILLSLGEKELSYQDKDYGIYLIDGTWKLATKMDKTLPFQPEKRSLPKGFKTAYRRRQDDCKDPESGLASIEALYIAYVILKRDHKCLLDHYHFKDEFLAINHELLQKYTH